MKLLILLPLLLQVCADDFHDHVQIDACSDTEAESMYGLDEEVMYYADYDRQTEVYTLPKFGDPINCPTCYGRAVSEKHICQFYLQVIREAMKDFPLQLDAPGAPLLYPRDHLRHSELNTLVCQASGFYPAPVVFSWTRDQLNISSFSVSQAFPQSDGTFTQFSTIQLLPEDGQVYSCSLEHPALKGERRTRLWEVQFQSTSLAPSVFCFVGLTLGLVGVALGTFLFLAKENEYC